MRCSLVAPQTDGAHARSSTCTLTSDPPAACQRLLRKHGITVDAQMKKKVKSAHKLFLKQRARGEMGDNLSGTFGALTTILSKHTREKLIEKVTHASIVAPSLSALLPNP